MSRALNPHGPDYGTTALQTAILGHYAASTQRAPMPWPRCPRQGTSVRALVRRRLLSRDGNGGLFISGKGSTALALRRAEGLGE